MCAFNLIKLMSIMNCLVGINYKLSIIDVNYKLFKTNVNYKIYVTNENYILCLSLISIIHWLF